MGRYIGPACKLCRRERMKLYLKGARCYTSKCAIEKRPYPPGQHGQNPVKLTNYGQQLREKQKVKRIYGILERQFRKIFKEANRMRGVTGENLLELLERRLDNVVYRMGLAPSRKAARQLVRHGHIKVNGKKVDIPSFRVKVGDEISLVDKMKENVLVKETFENSVDRQVRWLEVDRDNFSAKVIATPTREDIDYEVKENLIVELYSK